MPHKPRSLQRTPRSAGAAAKSRETDGSALPGVVAGLLRGQPELALLTKAAAGIAKLDVVDDRFALVSTILATRPGAVVLPPFDSEHTSTAPLVLRVRREAPTVTVLVLSSHPRGAGQPLLRTAQAGAHVITSPTAAELRAALASLLQSREVGQ